MGRSSWELVRPIRPLGLLLTLFVLLQTQAAQGDSDLETRFRTECPQGLARLEKVVENLSCEGYRPGSLSRYIADTIYFIKGDKKLEIRKYLMGKTLPDLGAGAVACQTQNSFFKFKQSSPGGPYLVEAHGTDPAAMKKFTTHIGLNVDNFMYAAFSLRDRRLRKLMEDPTFKLTSIKEVFKEGRSLVEVVFESPGGAFWADSGSMVLDPDLDWAVCEFKVNYKTSMGYAVKDDGRVVCRRWPGGFVFPKWIQFIAGSPAGGSSKMGVDELTIKDVKLGTVTDDKFTFAAFGIPDLPTGLPARTSFFALDNWIFWACLVCAVVSFGLLRSKKRVAV